MRQLIQQINNKAEIMARIFVELNQQENKSERREAVCKIQLGVPQRKQRGSSLLAYL